MAEYVPAVVSEVADVDAAFESAYTRGSITLARLFLPVCALFLVSHIPWDRAASPEQASQVTPIRVGLTIFVLALFVACGQKWFRPYYDWAMAFGVAFVGSSLSYMLYVMDAWVGIGGPATAIAISSGALRMRPLPTAIAAVTVSCVALGLATYGRQAPFEIATFAGLLITLTLLAVLYTRQVYVRERALFDSDRRLRKEKDQTEALLTEVTTMRAEREQWLENLARFLRHELKNQVTATETSVKLAGTTGSTPPPARAQRYLDRATRSLERMRKLVESATEATSLEAALAAGEMGPVDFATLVAERGQTFRASNPDKRFELLLPTSLVVRGSEVRLEQLIDKLLSNAVEHTAKGGKVAVCLERIEATASGDPPIVLRVENEGDALPLDRQGIFDPYVTTGRTSENTGLGLYVVKVIAEGHGGSVRAYDVVADSESAHGGESTMVIGAGFEVLLPG